jgi:molybdopterin-dependent oxidoreductase alpha subunit
MPSNNSPLKIKGPAIPGKYEKYSWVPLGIGTANPHPVGNVLHAAWSNLGNSPYALDILRRGACQDCSLGLSSLNGPAMHLCIGHLKRLKSHRMSACSEAEVADISRLRKMSAVELKNLGRLSFPLLYRPKQRGFSRVSWEKAIDIVANKWKEVSGSRQAYLARSSGLTNETYYLFSKIARVMGSNNIDLSVRWRDEELTGGLQQGLGVFESTISLSDLVGTDLILLWGISDIHNEIELLNYLHCAKKKGTRIVAINSMHEASLDACWLPRYFRSALFGTKIVDEFVYINAGGDVSLLTAVTKMLIEWQVPNLEFINAHTTGWENLVESVADKTIQELVSLSGVSKQQIDWLATTIARANSMVSLYSNQLSHHFGTQDTTKGLVNLHLMNGAIGTEYSGLMPLPMYEGFRAGKMCGISPVQYPGALHISEKNAEFLKQQWGADVSAEQGLFMPEIMQQCKNGEIDFLYSLGCNIFSQSHSPQNVSQALEKVTTRIHQDIYLNQTMLIEPKGEVLLLPSQNRYEQRGGTITNVERSIQFTPELVEHPIIGESKADWEILGILGQKLRGNSTVQFLYDSCQQIRQEMSSVIPNYKEIVHCTEAGDQRQWGGEQLCADGDFSLCDSNRASFAPLQLIVQPQPEGTFRLIVRRYKSGEHKKNEIFLSTTDAEALELGDGENITVSNENGVCTGILRIKNGTKGQVHISWSSAHNLFCSSNPFSAEIEYTTYVQINRSL